MQQPGVGMPGLQMPGQMPHGGPDQDEMKAEARRQIDMALQPQEQHQQQMLIQQIGQMQQFMDGVQVHGAAQDTHGVSAPPCATAVPAPLTRRRACAQMVVKQRRKAEIIFQQNEEMRRNLAQAYGTDWREQDQRAQQEARERQQQEQDRQRVARDGWQHPQVSFASARRERAMHRTEWPPAGTGPGLRPREGAGPSDVAEADRHPHAPAPRVVDARERARDPEQPARRDRRQAGADQAAPNGRAPFAARD